PQLLPYPRPAPGQCARNARPRRYRPDDGEVRHRRRPLTGEDRSNEKRHRLDRAVTLATAILPRSDAAAAQIPGGAMIFGQHPPFAAVTTCEVRIVRRGLRRSRMAAR